VHAHEICVHAVSRPIHKAICVSSIYCQKPWAGLIYCIPFEPLSIRGINRPELVDCISTKAEEARDRITCSFIIDY